MRIPIEWLKEYVDIKKSPRGIGRSFTSLGLMLEKAPEIYKKGDYSTKVLELEHRMDRSDWLSVMGCARDLAAFEGLELDYPEVYTKKGKKPSKDQIVDIKVECSDTVNRFNTRVFRGIKVKKSPSWLRNRLEAYGIPSINNIVDITNYVMVEFGQPMHAQDLSKMEAPEIVIRKAKKGETVTTLLGETIKVDEGQFVLTQKGKPTVIGGIVGGASTGVDNTTTDIVLDAGNYDQNNVRKSSRKLKIQNETVLRYDKFLNPKLTEIAIARATKLILDLAGGEYYENIDWYPKKTRTKKMLFRFSRLELLSGMKFSKTKVKKILEALEYKVTEETKKSLKLEVPYFRTDVDVEDDLVSDVLRINDYEKIPISLINSAPPTEITPEIYTFENSLRDICVRLGLHEQITNPLVSHEGNDQEQVILENALSSEQNALRTKVYTTLLPVTGQYRRLGYNEIGVFEIGKIYKKTLKNNKNAYSETRVLEVIYDKYKKPIEVVDNTKALLSGVLLNLGIEKVEYKRARNKTLVIVNKKELGEIRYDSFTLYTEILRKCSEDASSVLTKFQDNPDLDISLVMERNTSFGPIYQDILKLENVLSIEVIEDEHRKINKIEKRTLLLRITYSGDFERDKLEKLLKKHHVVLRKL